MASYDPDNIFARILRGDLSCHRVFEDEVALAFMDVAPRTEGHVLVIPKRAARTLFDLPPDDLAALMPRVQRVSRAIMRALRADGLALEQFNEAVSGQSVFHLHFHLLPRRVGVPLAAPGGPMEKPDVLAALATRIKDALD